MIALIDYDAGNIKSVEKALQLLGEEVILTRDSEVLLAADKVILPGVGNFGDAMHNLKTFGLIPVIHEIAGRGTPGSRGSGASERGNPADSGQPGA